MTADTAQPLAIDGGAPVRTVPWPVEPPCEAAPDPQPRAALAQALAEYLDRPVSRIALFGDHAEACRAALGTAIGADRGGEVLIPTLGADAWPAAVAAAGVTPIPVEVDAETGAIAPRALAQAAASSPHARAVVAVHAFGHPVALTELERALGTRALPLIEDATVALGASERGRLAGTVGAAGLYRLGPPGDGTAPCALVLPENAEPGQAPTDDAVDETTAGRALTWLRGQPAALVARRRLAWELTFAIRGMRGAAGMHHGRHVRIAYHDYVVRLRRIVWKRPLDATLAALRAEGIPCEAAFEPPAVHADPALRSMLGDDARLASDHFPVAERLLAEWIAFPIPSTGTQREVDDIVAALRKLEAAHA